MAGVGGVIVTVGDSIPGRCGDGVRFLPESGWVGGTATFASGAASGGALGVSGIPGNGSTITLPLESVGWAKFSASATNAAKSNGRVDGLPVDCAGRLVALTQNAGVAETDPVTPLHMAVSLPKGIP